MHPHKPLLRAYASGDRGELWIYDDIGPDWMGMIGAKSIAEELKKMGPVQSIRVHLNSVGGDVDEGTAIYNQLKKHAAAVDMEIDGAAYSIASIIAMSGDSIKMAENARMMIHNPWTYTQGTADELRKRAEALDLMRDGAIGTYASRTGQASDKIGQMMDAETWLSAEQCMDMGFCDEVLPNKAVAAKFDPARRGYRNAPQDLSILHSADLLTIPTSDEIRRERDEFRQRVAMIGK